MHNSDQCFHVFFCLPLEQAFNALSGKSMLQVVDEQGKAVLVVSNLGLGDLPQAVSSSFVVRADGVVLANHHEIGNV
jgi:hypothetical protein